jgi:hypothetical protein
MQSNVLGLSTEDYMTAWVKVRSNMREAHRLSKVNVLSFCTAIGLRDYTPEHTVPYFIPDLKVGRYRRDPMFKNFAEYDAIPFRKVKRDRAVVCRLWELFEFSAQVPKEVEIALHKEQDRAILDRFFLRSDSCLLPVPNIFEPHIEDIDYDPQEQTFKITVISKNTLSDEESILLVRGYVGGKFWEQNRDRILIWPGVLE